MYTWYRVQDKNEIHDIDELKIGLAKRGTWHSGRVASSMLTLV